MSKSTFSQFFTTEDNQPIVEIPTGKIDILNGDVFNMLPFLPDNHFHTVVTILLHGKAVIQNVTMLKK